MRVCAIDIGTVTTRMLVADVTTAGRLSEVRRLSRITHLGEGLSSSGELSTDAISRVTAAVEEYAATASKLGAGRLVALATSAARDASNADRLASALAGVGVVPEVIPGHEEARLSFMGATYDMRGRGVLVADPGGGSTELVFGDAACGSSEVRLARSVDVGARRMTETFFHHDPPTRGELEAARAWAAAGFRSFFEGLRERPRELVTLAGTATTLAAVEQGLDPYDPARVHGRRLDGAVVSALLEELASVALEERKLIRGLEPDRASVIVGGAVVVEAVLSLSGLDSTTVSEHDILYGIALDVAAGGR